MRAARAFACLYLAIDAALCGCGGGAGGDAVTTESEAGAGLENSTGAPDGALGGLDGRIIVGYQGWFGCPGDFEDAASWRHWFASTPSSQSITVDLLPDTSGYAAEDLCDTGLAKPDGSHVMVFSSLNPNVIRRHFALMGQYGIGGVALERFVSDLQDPMLKRRADYLLGLVLAAAISTGVPFFISYDVTGSNASSAIATIRSDWRDIDRTLSPSANAAYLRDGGKPVLQLWGVGFVGNPGTPDEVRTLLADLRAGNDGLPASTTVGGVPLAWRTLTEDAQPDSSWNAVYRSFDVLSPWTVGRVADEAGVTAMYATRVHDDLEALSTTGVRYLPVIFPGFSWTNLMRVRGAGAAINEIPRDCGRLLWAQAQSASATGAGAIYVAMFDEFDEGTALLPMAATRADVPTDVASVTRDQDGCTLPQDWYLSLVASIGTSLRVHGTLGAMPQPGP